MGVGWRVFEAHESGGFGLLCGRNALEGLLQTLSGACQGHGEMGSVLDWEFLALLVLQFDGELFVGNGTLRRLWETFLLLFTCLYYGRRVEFVWGNKVERTSSLLSLLS